MTVPVTTKTIGTNADYLTPDLWQTGQAKNMVSADVVERGAMLDEVHTSVINFNGALWGTDATHYVWLDAADGAQHNGTAGSGARTVVDGVSGPMAVTPGGADFHVTNLELTGTNQIDFGSTVFIGGGVLKMSWDNVILHNAVGDFSHLFLSVGAAIQTIDLFNCQFFNSDRNGLLFNGSNDVVRIWNCVFFNCSTRGEAGQAALRIDNSSTHDFDVRNNLFHINAGGSPALNISGTSPWNVKCNRNLISDSTGTTVGLPGDMIEDVTFQAGILGTGDRVMFANLTGGTEDLRLVEPATRTDNLAIEYGINLTAETTSENIFITVDAEGNTRDTVLLWDAGADSTSAVVTPPATPAAQTTVTTKTTSKSRQRMMTVQSAQVNPTDIVELSGLPSGLPHCFASIRFFDSGGLPVVPTAGTLTVLVQMQADNFEAVPDNVVTASAALTVPWAGNTEAVRITPTDLAGISTWQAILTFNLR